MTARCHRSNKADLHGMLVFWSVIILMNGVFKSDIHKNQVLRFVLKRVRPTPYNVHTRIHFSTNVKEFYECSLELINQIKLYLATQNHAYEPFLVSLIVLLKQTFYKNSKWVWSGKNTITNCRQTHGTARKSHTTITRHQEDKLSKAAKLEWT